MTDAPLSPADLQILSGFDTLPDSLPVSEALTSHLLGVAVKTLRNWRSNGKPPPFTSVSRSAQVRYPLGGIRTLLAAHTYDSSGQQSRARKERAAGYAPEDQPVLPQDRRRSTARSFSMFLASAPPDEVWPCVIYGPERLPLDLASALDFEANGGLSTDADAVEPEAAWLTPPEYARALVEAMASRQAFAEKAALQALAATASNPSKRRRTI